MTCVHSVSASLIVRPSTYPFHRGLMGLIKQVRAHLEPFGRVLSGQFIAQVQEWRS